MGNRPGWLMEHIIYTLAKAFQKKENSRKTKVPRKVWKNSIMLRFSWQLAGLTSWRTPGVELRLPSFIFSVFRSDFGLRQGGKWRGPLA
jgi:hypothetical protein